MYPVKWILNLNNFKNLLNVVSSKIKFFITPISRYAYLHCDRKFKITTNLLSTIER